MIFTMFFFWLPSYNKGQAKAPLLPYLFSSSFIRSEANVESVIPKSLSSCNSPFTQRNE